MRQTRLPDLLQRLFLETRTIQLIMQSSGCSTRPNPSGRHPVYNSMIPCRVLMYSSFSFDIESDAVSVPSLCPSEPESPFDSTSKTRAAGSPLKPQPTSQLALRCRCCHILCTIADPRCLDRPDPFFTAKPTSQGRSRLPGLDAYAVGTQPVLLVRSEAKPHVTASKCQLTVLVRPGPAVRGPSLPLRMRETLSDFPLALSPPGRPRRDPYPSSRSTTDRGLLSGQQLAFPLFLFRLASLFSTAFPFEEGTKRL